MKHYIKPDFSVQMFDVSDIITVSGDSNTLMHATVEGGETAWDTSWDGVYDATNLN